MASRHKIVQPLKKALQILNNSFVAFNLNVTNAEVRLLILIFAVLSLHYSFIKSLKLAMYNRCKTNQI